MPVSGDGGNDYYTKMLLHANELDNTTIVYESALGASQPERALSLSGGAVVDTAQKKFGSGSMYFPGTTSYGQMSYEEDYVLGDHEFTIDFWIRFEDYTVAGGIFCQEYATNSDYVFCYWNGSSGILQFRVYGAGFTRVDMTYDITDVANDTWYHVAIIRGWGGVTNSYAMCLDGVVVDTDSSSYTVPDMPASFEIGRETVGTNEYIEGWIDEFRITKGKPLWTQDFDVPTDQAKSWHTDHNVVLLLHADEDDNDTVTYDSSDSESGKTVTSNGVAMDESQKKFGITSGRFNGSSDYLSLADSVDWAMSTDPAQIDFWVRFNTMADVNGTYYGFFQHYENDNNYYALYHVQLAGTKYIYFKRRVGGADLISISGSWTPVVDTWYHVAIIRGWGGDSDDWAITVDGSTIATATDTDTWDGVSGTFEIGRIQSHPATAYLDGWLDEFRVLKGKAIWTADFSASLPTGKSRAGKYTKLLLHFDGEHNNSTIIDSDGQNTYTQGGALVDDAQYKFAPCSLYMDGSLDGYYWTDHSRFNFGNRPFTLDFWVRFSSYADKVSPFMGQRTDDNNNWSFYYRHVTPDPIGDESLNFWVESGGSGLITKTVNWTNNPGTAWHHIALIRGWENNANKFAIVVNGTALTTWLDSDQIPNFINSLYIGYVYSNASWNSFHGHIDELRLVIGDARWVQDFTPPTAPYTDSPISTFWKVNSVENPSKIIEIPSADIITVNSVGPS